MTPTLADAPEFKPLEVITMDSFSIEEQILLEGLGIEVGGIIEKERVAPFGDPITLKVGGARFTLRKEICQRIYVEEPA